MNGSTLIFEFGWCGFGRVGGPLSTALCLGFVSVSYVPFLLSKYLRNKIDGMKDALRRGKFPEMDAFGEKDER